jgi:ribosomal protein uS17
MAEEKNKKTDEAEIEETPVSEEPEAETPEAETPEVVAPEAAAPEAAAPDAAEPEAAAEEPAAEEPVVEEAAAEAPAEAPAVEEEAAAEEPADAAVADTPAAEAPAEEAAPPGVSGPKKKRKRLPRIERHKHAKPVREASAERKPIVRTSKPESEPGRRQERRGVVVSDKGDKSIVVKVEMIRAHAKYKKVVRRSNRLHAHDEQNAAGIGDVVRIVETRPLSKTKRWRLAEIVEKAR